MRSNDCDIGTLASPIKDDNEITDPNIVKVHVDQILKDDSDFQNYLTTFAGTDYSAYSVKKSVGKEFTEFIFDKFGKSTFEKLIMNPPNTKELKNPQIYLNRIK